MKLSYLAGILGHMALSLPQRFIARPVSEFVTGLELVHANYWYWEEKGDMAFGRPSGLMAEGSRQAMLWLSGQSPFPTCYSAPLPRTRANLLKMLRFSEMVMDGEGEQVDHEDGAVDITDRLGHAGARAVYQWALRITDSIPGEDLLPEEIRAAKRRLGTVQASTRDAA